MEAVGKQNCPMLFPCMLPVGEPNVFPQILFLPTEDESNTPEVTRSHL